MKIESRGRTFEIEPNSKPYLLKRMISDGFDITVLFIIFILLSYLITASPLGETFRTHQQKCSEIQQQVIREHEGNAEEIRRILNENSEYRDEIFAASLHGYLLKAVAAAIGEAFLFLVIPLTNEKRMTLGRRMTGLVVFSERFQSCCSGLQVFYRFMFTFLIESIAVYPWTGLYTFLLIPVIRLTVMMLNRKNKTICDFVTSTMIIEGASYSELR